MNWKKSLRYQGVNRGRTDIIIAKKKGQNHKQRFTKHYPENIRLNETHSIPPSVKKFLHDEKS